MKVRKLTAPWLACAALALWSPLVQSCVAGIQASNPTSVYVIDSSNGTVKDTRTGLMWDRCARGQSGVSCATGLASSVTWQAALNTINSIGTYKGYNDWRLPNQKELRSLVEECAFGPSINVSAFPSTPALLFWSGSPVANSASLAWGVAFFEGESSRVSRTSNGYVRLVRGGQ